MGVAFGLHPLCFKPDVTGPMCLALHAHAHWGATRALRGMYCGLDCIEIQGGPAIIEPEFAILNQVGSVDMMCHKAIEANLISRPERRDLAANT